MSKKWSIFRKKGNKADSHGTTAADEDIQFQPAPPRANEKVVKLSAVQSQVPNCDPETPADNFPSQRSSFKDKSGRGAQEAQRNDNSDWNTEGLRNLQLKEEESIEYEDRGSNDEINTMNLVGTRGPSVMPSHKTLTKPVMGNTVQRNYQQTQRHDVSISDEYSDPYDALRQKEIQKRNAVTDGYIEPYKAQEIFQNAVQGYGDSGEYDVDKESDQDHYQDPWDKRTGDMDYSTPIQSRNETLPYNTASKKNSQLGFTHGKRQTGSMDMGNSWGSGDISNSSDSPNTSRRRLVRVEGPRGSPKASPQFDRRLILPEPSGGTDNYSEPWSRQVKFKPVDKRLIKAEPSLEELRRMSPSGHNSSIGTGSPGSSGRGSPVGNLPPGLDLVHMDNTRRSSSPMAPGYPGLPPNLIQLNKSKSRSLDMRNHPQQLSMVGRRNINPAARFPKSASDEQLVGHNMGSAGNLYRPQAHGMSDYEEPWDKSQRSQTLVNHHSNAPPPVSHIRSRSYEISHHSSNSNDYLPNESSFYEQPWDKHNTNHHLQSIQRFQQRKLELHPSEAINTRDFDPLLPLEKQLWYHTGITRGQAEKRLASKCEGSYLVRKSESSKNSFSLSVQTRIGCIHMLMRCTRDGSWILGEFSAPFLSAPEMVSHYTRHKLKINDTDYVLLLYPVPDTDIL